MPINLEAAERYVLSRRTRDGGYCFYRTPEWGVEEPNAPDTLAALESLRLLSARPAGPDATASWLLGLQDEGGAYPTFTIGRGAIRALDVLGLAPSRSPRRWLHHWRATMFASETPPHDERAWLWSRLRLLELLRVARRNSTRRPRDRLVWCLRTARDERDVCVRRGGDLETVALALSVYELAGLGQPDGGAIVEFSATARMRRSDFVSLRTSVRHRWAPYGVGSSSLAHIDCDHVIYARSTRASCGSSIPTAALAGAIGRSRHSRTRGADCWLPVA